MVKLRQNFDSMQKTFWYTTNNINNIIYQKYYQVYFLLLIPQANSFCSCFKHKSNSIIRIWIQIQVSFMHKTRKICNHVTKINFKFFWKKWKFWQKYCGIPFLRLLQCRNNIKFTKQFNESQKKLDHFDRNNVKQCWYTTNNIIYW